MGAKFQEGQATFHEVDEKRYGCAVCPLLHCLSLMHNLHCQLHLQEIIFHDNINIFKRQLYAYSPAWTYRACNKIDT
uniref:Uncharacterized protein n=1 Tax=Arion vulgaris TaxID=1028688 RepID=A0A0B7AUI4_9EUPU